jgi:hypothetical protein
MCYDHNMTNTLSAAQFQHLAGEIHKGEGFSVKAFGPDAGKSPEYGHMVGLGGGTREMDIRPATALTPEHISGFVSQNEDMLSTDDHYLGGWMGNNEEGTDPRGSVNVSRRFNPYGSGRDAALAMAIQENQQAIGVLHAAHSIKDTQEEVPAGYSEVYNPYYNKKGSPNRGPLTEEQQNWISSRSLVGRRVADLFRR